MNFVLPVIGMIAGGFLGWLFALLRHRRRSKYLAHLEYWVLGDAELMPDLTKTMEAVMSGNPYGAGAIGPAEGLLFSDIRFKISFILASRNPGATWLVREEFSAAEGCRSALRVQYTSETPLSDKKHLQFCVHVADALARQTGAQYVLDIVADRLWSVAEFQAFLGRAKKATDFDEHVSLTETEDGEIEVKGLVKAGVPDLKTLPLQSDMLVLGRQIIEKYARDSWEMMKASDGAVEAYGDEFFLLRTPVRAGLQSARVMRRRAV